MVKAPYHQLRRHDAVAPAGCPINHTFSPYHPDYLKDPYQNLRTLRAETPVFYAAELGYVVLTRMADVAEVFKRTDVFSSEIVQDPVLPICAAARAILDVPDYTPSRSCRTARRPITHAFANTHWPAFRRVGWTC